MALIKQTFETRGLHPYLTALPGRIVGVTSGPSIALAGGKGFSVTRSGAGVYVVAFTESLGSIISVQTTLSATTPGNVKNHSLIVEALATTGFKLNFYDSSGVAHDLVALEWIGFVAWGTNSSLT